MGRRPIGKRNLPTFDEFVVNMAGRAARFFDNEAKEWAAIVRHRKRMSDKSRERIRASLERLIRETEKGRTDQ